MTTITPTTDTPANPLRTEERARKALEAEGFDTSTHLDGTVSVEDPASNEYHGDRWQEFPSFVAAADAFLCARRAWDAPPERPLPVPMTAAEIEALAAMTAVHVLYDDGDTLFGRERSSDWLDEGETWFLASTTTPADVYRYALAHTDESGRFVPEGK